MAAPTSYTEETLAAYMLSVTGKIAGDDVLGWNADDFAEAVNNALLVYGTDDITSISGADDIQRLRLLAVREAWRAIVFATAHEHDYGASLPGAVNTRRSQIHKHAKEMVALVDEQLVVMFPDANVAWSVGVNKIGYGDPYTLVVDEERQWSRLG